MAVSLLLVLFLKRCTVKGWQVTDLFVLLAPDRTFTTLGHPAELLILDLLGEELATSITKNIPLLLGRTEAEESARLRLGERRDRSAGIRREDLPPRLGVDRRWAAQVPRGIMEGTSMTTGAFAFLSVTLMFCRVFALSFSPCRQVIPICCCERVDGIFACFSTSTNWVGRPSTIF